jgi:predicted RNA-binding Zn-ribbon protein involved in translation (DUF1610 family)
MICPKCIVQMHQVEKTGGGVSGESLYVTWELKQCPSCGRYVKEYYSAKMMCPMAAKKLIETIKRAHKGELEYEEVEE